VRRRLLAPLAEFLRTEAGASVVLLAATVAALIWANVAPESYETTWATRVTFGVGTLNRGDTLQHWINDGLMAVFFFVVGLEIKRELVEGELREPRKAMLPVAAALGGMLVPRQASL
jgi:NhaA family Na+:H+ antiporter